METFNFEFWSIHTGPYPQGEQLKMGKGISVGVKPLLPIQRTFVLSFSALRWLTDEGGNYVSSVQPTRNILKLSQFYEAHLHWKRFILPHPVYGNVTVRFKDPFVPPKATVGGSGWTEPFEITVEEQWT